jgi:hypothetical protein
MQAFHNDPAIKEKYLSRVRQHIAADNLIRGIGWKDGKGCAVGCTLESYEHAQYPIELGIPEWLGRIEDDLFEGMSIEKSETWPEKFLDAIPVGLDDAEFLRVKAQFFLVVLNSALETFDHEKFPDVKAAIEGSILLWKRDDFWTTEWLKAAGAAAWAATRAARAIWGAGPTAARTAARAAREAAGAAAAEALEAAARAAEAASDAAAKTAKYDYFADELLRILKGTTDDN